VALPKVYRVVQDSAGNVVAGVLCSVLNQGTGVLATLWQDDAGTIPLTNPMTSDATYGSFGFYVEPGHYDLTFTKPGYVFQPQLDLQVPVDTLTLGSMATQDAHAVAITGGTVTGLTQLNGSASLTFGNYTVQHYSGNGVSAFYSTLLAAGGVDRYFLRGDGDAQSHLGGSLRVLGPVGLGGHVPNINPLGIRYQRATQNGIFLVPDADTGGAALYFANAAQTGVGSIVTNASSTAYNTSSDPRLKTDVQPLHGALQTIQALTPYAFRWKADGSPGQGLLADEAQQVVPDAVTGTPDAVGPDGQIRPMQMDYSKLVPWLIGACQELAQQVALLTTRVAVLEEARGGP
jgi:hypothetical protein